ncbi:MAG: PKD domain-containing protein [Saprospiraceae bacterium]|nr:PKD domain-containing protein [Saprospiraceae bacterium]
MIRFIILIIFSFSFQTILAQKHDYTWYLGFGDYSNNSLDSVWGRSIIDYNASLSNESIHYNGVSFMDFDLTNATISDEQGKFLFSYNGVYIEDASHKPMLNGTDMSDSGYEGGDILIQGGLILPLPGSNNHYVLFHQSWEYIDTFGTAGHKLYYSIIDMRENNGLGAVIEKLQLIMIDTLDYGKLTATRHANGRDWWILQPRFDNDEYHRILLTPYGPEILPTQSTGILHLAGLGQAFFSPDGSKYAMFSAISQHQGNYLHIYDFDRCTGLLSNPLVHHYPIGPDDVGGICFAPNSDLLYLMAYKWIYQFDLTSTDVIATKRLVATKDTYIDTIPGTGAMIPPSFFCGHLGPNGKIYISSIGSVRVLTTIDYPDKLGIACKVNQHSVHLPTVNTSLPNFPNYRLGPIDGSACDTLGIDNFPLSRFRSDQDTSDHLEFRFVDLSSYEPEVWYWEFGDGGISGMQHPAHKYSSPGVYEVCLRVSNSNGTDTFCETIHIGTTSTGEKQIEIQVQAYPNPFNDYLTIQLPDHYYPVGAKNGAI